MTPKDHLMLQSLINALDHPFVLIDSGYRIVVANWAYREAYGEEETERVVGRHCYEVSHHADRPCHLNGEDCPLQHVLQEQEAHTVFHTHYDFHGQPEHVRITGHPVQGPQGEPLLGESISRLSAGLEIDCEEMQLIGDSPALLEAVDQLRRVAHSDVGVLLIGESGVGKDLAARYVHGESARRGGAFQVVDCSTISADLFESELFGHEPGSFTGCAGRKQGLFELADGGTLFLDEIGELPLSMQAKLLRALETGQFRRLGGQRTLEADVRVVTATNRNLAAMVEAGTFREDLYYRLACITVVLPTLRERREDIQPLAEFLLARINRDNGTHCTLSRAALARLSEYDFPGNIRELRNILRRAVALCGQGTIQVADLGLDHAPQARSRGAAAPQPATSVPENGEEPLSLRDLEVRSIQELLSRYDGQRKPVAEALGVSERTLYRKLKRYGLR
ncbi:sigma-54 interaction domain-containing protein [Thiohalorhabdus sp. Cl-TMA]|uniref:Sigma-54 interaction domain-containing protein n=1 Tax=Thiohalorhabdus methylotrophus TaxID=3242694 RepID=A0ABV4TV15_9GAMM